VVYASWNATIKDNATGYLDGIGPINDLVSYSSAYLVLINYSVNPVDGKVVYDVDAFFLSYLDRLASGEF
jgi:hypothetical protein